MTATPTPAPKTPAEYEPVPPPSATPSDPNNSAVHPSAYRGWPGSPVAPYPYHMMYAPPHYGMHWAAAPPPHGTNAMYPPQLYHAHPMMMANPHMMMHTHPYPPMPPPHYLHEMHPKHHLDHMHVLDESPAPKFFGQYKTGRWSLDEKLLFLYGLKKFGKGKWKKISAYLPDR
jgi:hypothetical protein